VLAFGDPQVISAGHKPTASCKFPRLAFRQYLEERRKVSSWSSCADDLEQNADRGYTEKDVVVGLKNIL
jgi:hypothetical protein